MKKQNIFLVFALILFMAAGVTFLFFRNTEATDSSLDTRPRIAAIMIDPDVVFWNDVWEGVHDAASKNCIALSEYPYEQYCSDISGLIETAVLADVDGILLRSQDTPSDSLKNALQSARDKKIPIVTLDVDADSTYRAAFIAIDNQAAAAELAKKAADLLAEGKSAAVVKTPDEYMSQAAASRVTAFRNTFENILPEVKLTVIELPLDDGLRLPVLMQFLEEHKDIGLLFGCAPKVTSVSINAVSRLSLADDVCIVGFSESKEAVEAVKTGTVKCLVMQEPYTMGKNGLEYLNRLCTTDEQTETSLITTPFRLITPEDFHADSQSLNPLSESQ